MARASLPMYDLPEAAAATDAWWAGLARALMREGVPDVPARLTRLDDHEPLWRAPDLLFSQTCGYPLTHAFANDLAVVATPAHEVPGCDGPNYSSAIVVRADDPAGTLGDLRGRVAAVNADTSQSGYSALRAAVAPLARGGRFFGRVVTSGGHGASLAMVAEGTADVCATDSVTFAMLARYRPDAVESLRVLDRSPTAPGLPYVTRAHAGDGLMARLRAALFAALDEPDLAEARAALFIAGAEVLPPDAYRRIIALEDEAKALGYPAVA